jgi:glutathione synthase/RimK-type ligase-like ATP-grasp enzyme
MPRNFLIVTLADDLHGLAVQAAVRKRGFACHIVESDNLTGRESINYAIGPGDTGATILRNSEGGLLDASSLDAIWWRRFRSDQQIDPADLSETHRSLINNDCVGALVGSIQNTFAGKWISSPKATDYASNKLNQLAAAHKCGLRIPDTVVTQSPSVVREFCERHDGRIIVKPVAGTPGPLLFTQLVGEQHLQAEDSIRACPAIYQEYILGATHIRLNCFGNQAYASRIVTQDVDWRPNLNVPISPFPVPKLLQDAVRNVLDGLGLDMGIIDLKQTPDGEFVWLEVNPQGQFLFLEGLTKEPLTEHFTDYFTKKGESIPAPAP